MAAILESAAGAARATSRRAMLSSIEPASTAVVNADSSSGGIVKACSGAG